jgi:hypothetical protein
MAEEYNGASNTLDACVESATLSPPIFALIVYRLGQEILNLQSGVRFPVGAPSSVLSLNPHTPLTQNPPFPGRFLSISGLLSTREGTRRSHPAMTQEIASSLPVGMTARGTYLFRKVWRNAARNQPKRPNPLGTSVYP